ncbi:hypothetical protein FHG87_025168 [Trinorchestia longiramus]|nr:hypothetical protein FHG87_025168 [Trinorchestia longiramus]
MSQMYSNTIPFTRAGFSRCMSTVDKWFRPVGPFELFTDDMYKNHGLVISYYLRFATSRPVTEEEVKKVCTHLYRKAINLRLIPKERDGETWFKELPLDYPIDFEVRRN